MPQPQIHRFEHKGKRYALDPQTCFCFECDAISWDVLGLYPQTPVDRIYHELRNRHDERELAEVVGELEWLRSTKSILTSSLQDDLKKELEVEQGVKHVAIRLPDKDAAHELVRDVVGLLLGRSGQQKELRLEFILGAVPREPTLIAEYASSAMKAATLAGKALSLTVHVSNVPLAKLPEALRVHRLGLTLAFKDATKLQPGLDVLAQATAQNFARWAKSAQKSSDDATLRVVVTPGGPNFAEAVRTLEQAGIKHIELDIDGAFTAEPGLAPSGVFDELSKTAEYYAEQLIKQRLFRIDPIAPLFWRVFDGSPLQRSDPAGTNSLVVDSDGAVYPSTQLVGIREFKLGSVTDGALDETRIRQFEDLGAVTTPPCRACWARYLCGGGSSAVHHALSGSIRNPHEAWCDAQRAWMASAIAAFNLLSSHGINFTRIYQNLGPTAKPSLLKMAKAALTMTISMRPTEEEDAGMLVEWENWNESAYFLCNEFGFMLAARYDREMESLHPGGVEQEMVITKRNGDPIGLLKIRPERYRDRAEAWVYLTNPADYESDSIRKGFRAILNEAGKQQALRRLTVQAADHEKPLQAFLQAVGFEHIGTLREALFLHDAYHDVAVYSMDLN